MATNKKFVFALVLFALILSSGCSINANKYESSVENIQQIRRSGDSKVDISGFKVDPAKAAEINNKTFRGSSFSSPYESDYAKYLEESLKQEFKQANRYDPNSNIKVSGIVLNNEFDASGMSVGLASITAVISVTKGGTQKYKKEITAKNQWESSFSGFSALPAGQKGYVELIQKFIAQLLADQNFINAIK